MNANGDCRDNENICSLKSKTKSELEVEDGSVAAKKQRLFQEGEDTVTNYGYLPEEIHLEAPIAKTWTSIAITKTEVEKSIRSDITGHEVTVSTSHNDAIVNEAAMACEDRENYKDDAPQKEDPTVQKVADGSGLKEVGEKLCGSKEETIEGSKEDEDDEEEEDVMTIDEMVKQDEEETALLGGISRDECTYKLGAMARQPLYACITCSVNGKSSAGMCLACTIHCHEDHKIVEMYTKRNFTCDCGNSLFPKPCTLNPQKNTVNVGNNYDNTFAGLYCTCQRPFPDESSDACIDGMVQCVVCEDWFHLRHLNFSPADEDQVSKTDGDFSELICHKCMSTKASMLKPYYKFLGEFSDVGIRWDNEELELKESSEQIHTTQSVCSKPQLEGSESVSGSSSSVAVAANQSEVELATVWKYKWRLYLCRCVACLNQYQINDIPFITDWDDSLTVYEERARKAEEEKVESHLEKMPHLEKQLYATAMHTFKNTMSAFFQNLVEKNPGKKVITCSDVNEMMDGYKKALKDKAAEMTKQLPPDNCH